MNLRIKFGLLVLLLSACAANAEPATLRITVNVYNDAAVPGPELLKAEEVARRILRQAGMEGVWLNCKTSKTSSNPDAACLTPMSSVHLALRLLPWQSAGGEDSVFGISFLGQDGIGTYADVFYPSVQSLCKEVGANPSAVLGSVMAHELGHLMLGTHSHSPIGIMRPQWHEEELQQIGMGRLLFTPEQARKMHARLLATREEPVPGSRAGATMAHFSSSSTTVVGLQVRRENYE